tara:strand:- start:10 stop:246 length:237 start_codon:yes stop_codon:yes gene_type:complete
MDKIIDYLKELGATKVAIVNGPNGDFLSWTSKTDTGTIPVGKKSQGCIDITEYNYVTSDDGTVIATVNNYETVAEFTL